MLQFHALADPTRFHIVEMLAAQGRLSAGEIVRQFRVSAPAISQHLKVLKEAGLVTAEVKAQSRIYHINPQGFTAAQDWLKHVTELWSGRFDALEEFLANEPKE